MAVKMREVVFVFFFSKWGLLVNFRHVFLVLNVTVLSYINLLLGNSRMNVRGTIRRSVDPPPIPAPRPPALSIIEI